MPYAYLPVYTFKIENQTQVYGHKYNCRNAVLISHHFVKEKKIESSSQ